MVWKALIFLSFASVLLIGVSAGRYGLKWVKRDQLQGHIEEVCKGFGNYSSRDQMLGLSMGAVGCIFESVDEVITEKHPYKANATAREHFLDTISEFCEIRQKLRVCGEQLLEYLAPCASESVQAQLGNMKAALTDAFRFFCDDDMAKTRHFVNDGAVECLEMKVDQINNCTNHMVRLVTGIPEDTKSDEAVVMCQKYDTTMSCVLDTLSDCPKASTKELIESLSNLFRSATFCRVTLPLQSTGNDT